jgi:hypothetical protein
MSRKFLYYLHLIFVYCVSVPALAYTSSYLIPPLIERRPPLGKLPPPPPPPLPPLPHWWFKNGEQWPPALIEDYDGDGA